MTTQTNPYADAALEYLDSGLGYPIPSPEPFAKFPPLVGWTGKEGRIPSHRDVEDWRINYPYSNILLRLAQNVIGIDVDDYDDKHGAETMHKATKVHGVLPEAPFSSARGPGYSGIRYYTLWGGMDERKLKGDLGPDSHVEVIRFSHRYAVVPPSWHQGAEAPYKWYSKGDAIPHVSDLSSLPLEWYEHLTQKCECFYKMRQRAYEQQARYRNRPSNTQGTMLAMLDLEHNIDTLTTLPKGSRNNYLSRIAGRTFLFDCLMNNVLDPEEVWTQLMEAALDAGLNTEEVLATLHSARRWATDTNEGNEE